MALEAFESTSQELAEAPASSLQPLEAARPAPVKNPSGLKGTSKAAVLLVALGTERAADIFRFLKEDEIEALSLEMAQLGSVPSHQTEQVLYEIVETAKAADFYAEGGVEFAREV